MLVLGEKILGWANLTVRSRLRQHLQRDIVVREGLEFGAGIAWRFSKVV